MILHAISTMYAAAAARRRRWFAAHPGERRRLPAPVVSVGNLRAGGSGKTPIVAEIARLLLAAGERPAVLTRGYGRRHAPPGVTVVSDGTAVLADAATAGDEPLMLARALPGAPVLVCADRYLAGALGAKRFGATVHVLDDGFQHFALARDVDLLVTSEDDLRDRPLPEGRLREPIAAARAADALIVTAPDGDAVRRVADALGVATAFRAVRAIAPPRGWAPADGPAFAVAAIARPERFFGDLAAAGWQLAGTRSFRDHHWFDRSDVNAIGAAARAAGAKVILTTEKDAVRFEGLACDAPPIAAIPLRVSVDPPAAFADWLLARVKRARVAA